jgi:serine/threonine protein phosphatase PrpC
MVGNRLVFERDASSCFRSVEIQPKDKFLVMSPESVNAIVHHEMLFRICTEARNVTEIATSIRNHAMAVMTPENVAVMVIDLQNPDEEEVNEEASGDGFVEGEESSESSQEEEIFQESLLIPDDPVIDSVPI